jgi:hypothetical protein
MKIYLASCYDDRFRMVDVADKLEGYGHTITSKWIYGDHVPTCFEYVARRDLDHIADANMFILFVDNHYTTTAQGRYTELGYALAIREEYLYYIYVVGKTNNIFASLADCTFGTLEDLYEHMSFNTTTWEDSDELG